MTEIAAIVLAGGQGGRMRRDVNKVYLPVGGRDMLEYSLQTFDLAPRVTRIVIVVRPDDRDHLSEIMEASPLATPTEVVGGGATRHQSEMAGLGQLAPAIEAGEIRLVAIHDGARPFLTLGLLDALLDAALEHGGSVPALPVEAPLYQRTNGEAQLMPLDSLRRMQTPQVFEAVSLLSGYRAAAVDGFEGVDTAETVERYTTLPVATVPGDPRNIKVTFIEDLWAADELIRLWRPSGWMEGIEGSAW